MVRVLLQLVVQQKGEGSEVGAVDGVEERRIGDGGTELRCSLLGFERVKASA